MKLRELERLRAENSRLRDDAGILQDNEDRAMAMAAESEDRAAVLADELAAGGESLGDMACARGVTELNPQVAKKLTALETRNAELSALVSLGSVEHVRDIEVRRAPPALACFGGAYPSSASGFLCVFLSPALAPTSLSSHNLLTQPPICYDRCRRPRPSAHPHPPNPLT